MNKALEFEIARLSAILYSIIKHRGENGCLTLEDAANDKLPERVCIGYNIAGDDAIITLLEDEQIDDYVIETEAENVV